MNREQMYNTLIAPVINACEAITDAAVARITKGIRAQSGAMLKNGFLTASGSASNNAPSQQASERETSY